MEEKEEIRRKRLRAKDKFDGGNHGKYERIYPLPQEVLDQPDNDTARELQAVYDTLVYYSKEIWAESAAGGFSRRKTTQDVFDRTSSIRSPDKGIAPTKD